MTPQWDMTVFHEIPECLQSGYCLSIGDVDGDGEDEVVVGGPGGLIWYRPATRERGTIQAGGTFTPELALEDIDDDGLLEIVGTHQRRRDGGGQSSELVWYKFADGAWARHVICEGAGGHDVLFADVDGDGQREIVSHDGGRGTAIYKRNGSVDGPWAKHDIIDVFREGLAVSDLNGDGKLEIVHGGDLFFPPPEGALAGSWRRVPYAPNFREMCRVALCDITGNGRDDIVIAESEFLEGRASWFENRMVEDPAHPWVEHPLDYPVYYAHSLAAWREGGGVKVFLAEMKKGGWNAPQNFHARLITYATADGGASWDRAVIYRGSGTHEAKVYDIDGDGELEIVGKECCQGDLIGQPKIQIWKRAEKASPIAEYRHAFVDRDKPDTATDILAVDVDGDGLVDIACGRWWYRAPSWERFDIPGINQVHACYDIDGDGRQEIIATRGRPGKSGYGALTAELCWARPIDPARGEWEIHDIGTGHGDWPHGTLVAPVLPGGKLALIACYHSAHAGDGHEPELFEIPEDPTTPWPKRILAGIVYGEQVVACDVNGNGVLDLVAGPQWLENKGDGTFARHTIVEDFPVARVAVFDVNGDGRPDVVLGGEVLDFKNKVTPFTKLAWFENPADPTAGPWEMHAIDTLRCPHSVGVGDLDGDGEIEIVAGEHDPFYPYRAQCRLYAYKKADPAGRSWRRWTLDDRFEHHDGAKVVELAPGKPAIISHGWKDSIYVNLWTR